MNNNLLILIILVFLFILAFSYCAFSSKKIEKEAAKIDDKIFNSIKRTISPMILSFVADAEFDYIGLVKMGAIKKSQVIVRIFNSYPVLGELLNKDKIYKWIDLMIDQALDELKISLNENENVIMSNKKIFVNNK